MRRVLQKENERDEVTIYWFSLLELTELGSGVNVSGINAKKTKKTESEREPTRWGVRAAEGMKTSKVGKTLKLISTSKQTPKHEDPPATQRNNAEQIGARTDVGTDSASDRSRTPGFSVIDLDGTEILRG